MVRFWLRLGDQEYALPEGHYFIGRGPAADIRIDDELVSRRHAILHVGNDRVDVEDLNSHNGLYVDGRRVRGTLELRAGDKITIGIHELELVRTESQPPEGGATRTIPAPPPAPVPKSTATTRDASLDLLSPREKEVLGHIAEGYSQREVAELLGVSIKTVETYKARIAEKLGLRTRTELVRYALNAGLLKPD